MNFPTLFYGSARPKHMKIKFSYQKIAKWELMHEDNNFATHITNIFFKAIKITIYQISLLAWVYIGKGELQGKKLTAKDVCNPTNLERLIRSPFGFRSLRRIKHWYFSWIFRKHQGKHICIDKTTRPPNFVRHVNKCRTLLILCLNAWKFISTVDFSY